MLDAYRANFVKGCAEGDSDSGFPSGERERICGCIADVHMKGKKYDDLAAEDTDAAATLVAPAVEACKFKPHGRAWAARVPRPRPLELYTKDKVLVEPEPKSEDLIKANELSDAGRYQEAEPILQRLVVASPNDAELAFEHYVNLSFLDLTDSSLNALEDAYKLGFRDYPTMRYVYKPGGAAFSTRYEKVLAGVRDRYNKNPPPAGTPLAFKPKGRKPKDGFPAIVVLHAYGSSNTNWVDFAKDWASHGFVAIALPGSMPLDKGRFVWHVGTVAPTHDQIQAAIKSELVADLIDPKRVNLVGFGQGANHALGVAAAHSEAYAGVFAISPGGLPEALEGKEKLETKGKPRLVLITGTDSESSKRSHRYQRLAASAGWPVVLLEQPGTDNFPEEYPRNGIAIMDYLKGKIDTLKGSPKLKPVPLEGE